MKLGSIRKPMPRSTLLAESFHTASAGSGHPYLERVLKLKGALRLSPDFRPHRVAVNFGPHQRHSILRTGCLTTDAQDGPD